MNIKKKILRLENYSFMLFFLMIVLTGAILNVNVMNLNDGRMPVYNPLEPTDTDRHFGFDDKDDVQGFWSSDIIPLGKEARASLGDLFMSIGIVGIVILLFQIGNYKFRSRKNGDD